MIDAHESSINSTELSKLRPGTVKVGVPLLDGLVPLHSIPIDERIHLEVAIEKNMIIVKRDDDEPLQVRSFDPHRPPLNAFRAPISDLVMIRGRGENDWTPAGEDISIASDIAFADFIDTLTPFALAKQTGDRRSRSIVRVIADLTKRTKS